jgi:hypothetical protein
LKTKVRGRRLIPLNSHEGANIRRKVYGGRKKLWRTTIEIIGLVTTEVSLVTAEAIILIFEPDNGLDLASGTRR